MTVVTPTILTYDGPPPTYEPVSSTDYIDITQMTFIHFYNGSEVNDAIVISASEADEEGSWGCQLSMCEAGGELILGPFDLATYSPTIIVTHTQTTDVEMAVLSIVQEVVPISTNISLSITPTVSSQANLPATFQGIQTCSRGTAWPHPTRCR